MREIKIDEKNAGGRLDKAIIKYLDKAPRGFVYKMLRKKNIVLNGRKAQGSEILAPGDRITLFLAEETLDKFSTSKKNNSNQTTIQEKGRSNIRFQDLILYEDENLLALNKPSGLLSQKSKPDDDSMNDMLRYYLGKDELFTPGISNRLDRNTSGIILAGKNPKSVRLLNEAIKNRNMQKLYLALIAGELAEDIVLEGYLEKDEGRNRSRVLAQDAWGKSQNSTDRASYIKTGCRLLSTNGTCSVLEVDLVTGKPHQIRAQLASIGHPIAGDGKYGHRKTNDYFKQKYAVTSQLLHAYQVSFCKMEGMLEYLNDKTIFAPVPEDFRTAAKGEGLCLPGVPEAYEDRNLNN